MKSSPAVAHSGASARAKRQPLRSSGPSAAGRARARSARGPSVGSRHVGASAERATHLLAPAIAVRSSRPAENVVPLPTSDSPQRTARALRERLVIALASGPSAIQALRALARGRDDITAMTLSFGARLSFPPPRRPR